jgi:hypothetical protein
MAYNVFIVTGPRISGKSTLVSAMVKEVCRRPPHYMRLATVDGTKKAPPTRIVPNTDCGVATATWVDYAPDHAFEALPKALAAVHKRDRHACVILEADTDPNLRHAYSYDCRIFVMPAPETITQVFRTPDQAREAMQCALHDTTAFASEVFGVPDDEGSSYLEEDHAEPRADMSDTQVIRFLRTPLGRDLASRIQCQPEYHGMVECDVVVVNTGVGGTAEVVDDVVSRLERLIAGTKTKDKSCPTVFCCDLADCEDPRRMRLFQYLRNVYDERK